MGHECPFCNEGTLSWEDFGNFQGDCAGCRVCTSCGGVVDENYLTADEGIRSSSGQAGAGRYDQATAKERQLYNIRSGAPSVSKGRRVGLDLTKRIAHYMDCKPSMSAEAVGLFERLVVHPDFRSRHIVAKLAIAACSVYIVCRRHNWPVMLADMCGMVGNSLQAVNSWKNRIMMTFPDLADIQAPDLFSLLEARCEKAAVSNDVQQTAIAIIKLCRDLWITEGRKQDNIVVAALFTAWQSEEPVHRVKVKLHNFCRDYQMPDMARRASVCLGIMRQTLCRLAEKIPWVTASSVNVTGIPFHVKDIISYRSTLIAEARSDILRIQCNDDSYTADTVQNHSECDIICESSSNVPERSSVNADDAYIKPAVTRNTNVTISTDSVLSHCTTTASENVESKKLAVKREHADYYESFWPPPGYKPYKKARLEESKPTVEHPNLDCAHLSTHDIPDEDMHLYIKSERQLDVFKSENDAHVIMQ